MSVEFDTPANRIIAQQQPKDKFKLNTSLPNITFLRHLSVLGRLTYDFTAATGTSTISITPAVGETQFIYQIIFNISSTGSWTISIQNNGIERSRITISTIDLQSDTFTYDIVDSLVGDGTKSLDIVLTELGGSATMSVTILGWNENTSRIRDVTT